MTPAQLEEFFSLTRAVRRLFHKLGHGATALHKERAISVGMRGVLEAVIEEGPQTVPKMARMRSVTRQHIQGLVNALMDGGYVATVDNPVHKRSVLITATERGQQLFEAMRARENAALLRAPTDASPEEMAVATKVLQALIATFDGPQWRAALARDAADDDGDA